MMQRLEYLQSFKDGIIENIDVKEEKSPSFVVSSIDEVKKRIKKAEDSFVAADDIEVEFKHKIPLFFYLNDYFFIFTI